MAVTEVVRQAEHMARALRLATRGRRDVAPNPCVGCVVVRDGEVVGEGWHERAGGAHAEIRALEAAGDAARGADVFVSLEPCHHRGRTPPCTDALIEAGVARVFAAMEDPNPRVEGQGLAALRGAGIEVDCGLMEDEARTLNPGFEMRMRQGRPRVTLKLAMTLDGRTGAAGGESQWITSEAARADAHGLRATAGAILTGVRTVIADDPRLTVRGPHVVRQPDRAVMDTALRAPPGAKLWTDDGARRIALTVRPPANRLEALRARGVEVVLVGTSGGRVDPRSALEALGRLEINDLLVECGPTLAGSLLQAGLVDELVTYVAPGLLGAEANALAELPEIRRLDERIELHFTDVRTVGPDLRITAVPAPR